MSDSARSADGAKDAIKIFAGNSNPALTAAVCQELGVPVARADLRRAEHLLQSERALRVPRPTLFAGVDRDLSGPKGRGGGRHPLPESDSFAAFLASHGVTSASTVVGGKKSSRKPMCSNRALWRASRLSVMTRS